MVARAARHKGGRLMATRLWTPEQDLASALVAHWDAQQGVTQAAGSVSQWTDTVAGIAATQGTASNQPTFSATTRNGKPGLSFGGNQFLSFSSATFPKGSAARSLFVAGYMAKNTTSTRTLFNYGSTGSWVAAGVTGGSAGKALVDTWGTFTSSQTLWSEADVALYWQASGSAQSIVVDGGTAYTSSNNLNTSGNGGLIGTDAYGGQQWIGSIQQALVFNRLLTADERQQLEGWESWYDG